MIPSLQYLLQIGIVQPFSVIVFKLLHSDKDPLRNHKDPITGYYCALARSNFSNMLTSKLCLQLLHRKQLTSGIGAYDVWRYVFTVGCDRHVRPKLRLSSSENIMKISTESSFDPLLIKAANFQSRTSNTATGYYVTEVTRNCVHHLSKETYMPTILNISKKIHIWDRKLKNILTIKKNIYLNKA